MPLTPPQPDPPRLRQFPASCRHGTGSDRVPWQRALTLVLRRAAAGRQQVNKAKAGNQASRAQRPAFAFEFSFVFRGWRAQEPVQGRAGRVRRGVRGMDAAAKPPWMGSRRPRLTPPARPSPRNPLFAEITSHEGAPPMAANRAPAQLFARIPEPCAGSRIDPTIDDNVVPTRPAGLSPRPGLVPRPPHRRPPRATSGPASRAAPSGPARHRKSETHHVRHVSAECRCTQCRTLLPLPPPAPPGLAAGPGRRGRCPARPGPGGQLCRRRRMGPGQDLPGRRHPAEGGCPVPGEPGHLERTAGPSGRRALLHQPGRL